MAGLKKLQDNVTKTLERMTKSPSFFPQYVTRYFQPEFIEVQQRRFMTTNESEGSHWDALNPVYAAFKKRKYADSFGHGTQINIASGRLFKSLTLQQGADWQRLLSDTTVIFNFNIEYAKYVDERRPILEFAPTTLEQFKKNFRKRMQDFWLQRA